MKTQNDEQIEMKLMKIKEYVNDNKNITTLKEIADFLNVSKKETKSILLSDPEYDYEVMNLIAYNRTKKLEKKCKSYIPKKKKACLLKKKYVLDASISGAEDNELFFSLLKNSIIVLTSITIRELDKLQKREDRAAWFARKVLAIANEKPECFEFVKINESCRIADDNILMFCKENKDDFTLLTSDKVMALKARYSDIDIIFLKAMENENKDLKTLFCTLIKNGKLYIKNCYSSKKCVKVINSTSYGYGEEVELKIGDDVYIASKKGSYINFSHLRVRNLNCKENCIVVYTTKIRRKETVSKLKCSYKSFIRDFNKVADVLV